MMFKTTTPADNRLCHVWIKKYVVSNGDEFVEIVKDILAPKGTFGHDIVKVYKNMEVFRQSISLTYATFEKIAYCTSELKSKPIPDVIREFIKQEKGKANEAHINETCGSTDKT